MAPPLLQQPLTLVVLLASQALLVLCLEQNRTAGTAERRERERDREREIERERERDSEREMQIHSIFVYVHAYIHTHGTCLCKPVYLIIHLSVYRSICLSIYLSLPICLSVHHELCRAANSVSQHLAAYSFSIDMSVELCCNS